MEVNPYPSKPQKIFVGGPIRHAVSQGAFDSSLQSLIISVLDVLEDETYEVFSAHRDEAFSIESEKFCSQRIAERDFDWMNRCDVFVAILPPGPDGVLRTDGTHIELGWASALGKSILVVTSLPVSKNHLLCGLRAVACVDYVSISEVQKRPQVVRETLERRSR